MKFFYISAILAGFSTTLCSANNVVSGSSSRLPMSLSSVINDLEAEGASQITTFAFLTSKGVTRAKRAKLLTSLFGITGEGDHDEEVVDGETTAFGKKMGDDEHSSEELTDDDDGSGSSMATGVAVANPLPGASVTEVAATVQACGGNIVFVASLEDLSRGEGLFDKLAPSIERILNEGPSVDDSSSSSSSSSSGKNLVIAIEGATTSDDLLDAKAKLENAAAEIFSNIVQPKSGAAVSTLQQVFDSVEYVSSNGPVDELLDDIGGKCDPATAMANVANSVFQDSQTQATVAGLHGSPLELAAGRKLLPLSREALEVCLNTVSMNASDEEGNVVLNRSFGSLCDAAVKNAMEQFDKEAGDNLLANSSVAKRIRSDLVDEMYSDLERQYDNQLTLLHDAAFESFKSSLSKLRLSPRLAADMEKVAADAVKLFSDVSKTLRAKNGGGWSNASAETASLKKELKEYITLRLQVAKASGKYVPVPRKGVTMGFHWLLPKPFGNDYRLEPWQVHAKDDLVYVPDDKITDVRKEDVLTGDWRDSVVPCPTANEMMYLK